MDGEAFAIVLLAGARVVTYVGLIGLTGAVTVRWLLPCGSGAERRPAPDAERRLAALAAGAGSILLVGTAARLYAQTWSVFGLDEPVTLELVRVVGFDSRWGGRWQPQAACAVLAAVAAAGWSWWPRTGGWIAAAATAGLWVMLPLTGHAASFDTPIPWGAQVVHGIGAGVWIGALAAVVAVAFRFAAAPAGHRRIADLVQRFSPLAVVAVAGLASSGAVLAVLYVGALADLRTTGYGRVLLLKIGLFLATGAVGAYNWRRVTPRLGDPAGTRALLRSARVELALAAAVLLVTAVLVHLAMPREME